MDNVTANIVISKSYPLDNGDVSGMFKVPREEVTEDLRIALIKLEGKTATVTLPDALSDSPQAPNVPEHELSGMETLKMAQERYKEGDRLMSQALLALAQEELYRASAGLEEADSLLMPTEIPEHMAGGRVPESLDSAEMEAPNLVQAISPEPPEGCPGSYEVMNAACNECESICATRPMAEDDPGESGDGIAGEG